MKRSLLKLGMIALILSMNACGGADTKVNSATSENMAAQGENIVKSDNNISSNNINLIDTKIDSEECLVRASRLMGLLRAQKWNDLREMSDSKMKKALTDDVLLAVWNQYISPAGSYVEKISDFVMFTNGNQVVELVTRFKNDVVVMNISFDTNGLINGFYFTEVAKSESWPFCHRQCVYATEKILGATRQKDWTFMHKVMSENINNALPDNVLENVHGQIYPGLGKYVAFSDRTITEKDGVTTVVEVSQYEKGKLVGTLAFDGEGKLVGFDMTPQIVAAEPVNKNLIAEKVIVSATSDTPLNGVLTLPKSGDKFPVVILIHGSGPNDMDETYGPNKPFKDIAEGLAERGIATLRYDKRTLAQPSSVKTIEDEYFLDVSAAISMMQKDARIGKIFVLGHSEGGSLIPAISIAHPEISGVISMAGTLREMQDSVPEQLNIQLEYAKTVVDAETYAKNEAQIKALLADFDRLRTFSPDLDDDEVIFYTTVRHWRSLHNVMQRDDVSKMTHPFFIAQGMDDIQVFYDRDYKIWEEKACTRDGVTCKAYPGLNHMMIPSQGFKHGEEYTLAGKVSSEFVDDVAKFVLAN